MSLILIADHIQPTRDGLVELVRSRFDSDPTLFQASADLIRELKKVHADLVILNPQLPDLKGKSVELLHKLRGVYSPLELPILILVEKDDEAAMADALNAGANDCLGFPFSPELTAARIRNQLSLKEETQRLLSNSFPTAFAIDRSDHPDPGSQEESDTDSSKRKDHGEKSGDRALFPADSSWDRPLPCEIPLNLFVEQQSYFCKTIWITPAELLLLTFEDLPQASTYRIRMPGPDGKNIELEVSESRREPAAVHGAGVLKLNVKLVTPSSEYDEMCALLLNSALAGTQQREQGTEEDGPKVNPTKTIGAATLLSASALSLNVIKGTRYKFLKYLGRGGFASVFLVKDLALKRPVAMKVLNRDYAKYRRARANFLTEAQIAAQFHHPNIAFVYEVGDIPSADYDKYLQFPAKILKAHPERLIYFTMQYVEGRTLTKWMAEKGNDAEGKIVDLLIETAKALDFAHGKGVIHRDIKPDNIMITPESHVLVTDFGIATITKIHDQENQKGKFDIACTPFYASPEQLNGRLLDSRSDLYSFGIMAYQVLTGELPFRGKSLSETVGLQLNAQPPSLSKKRKGITPELEQVVLKCLRKRPENRFNDAGELLEKLYEIKGTATGPETGSHVKTIDELVRQAIVAQSKEEAGGILEKITAFINLQKTYDDVDQIKEIKTKLTDPALLTLLIEKNLNKDNQQHLYEFFIKLDSNRTVPKLLQFFKREKDHTNKQVLAELAVLAAGRDLLPLVGFGLELGDSEACVLLKGFGKVAGKFQEPIFLKWAGHKGLQTQLELLRILSVSRRPESELIHIYELFGSGRGSAHPKVREIAKKRVAERYRHAPAGVP